jgi:hypothetical protein
MTPSRTSTKDVGEFAGKRVLVTGGTKGAGKPSRTGFCAAAQPSPARRGPRPWKGRRLILFSADVSTPEGASKVVREIAHP